MRVPPKVAAACDPLDAPGPRQDSSDLTVLYRDAVATRAEHHRIAAYIAKAGGGRVLFENDLKDPDSAKRKIAEKYHGDASRICDLRRNRCVFTSAAALYAGVEAALDRYPGIFVQLHDRLVAPKANGYADFSMSVRLSNGHIAETQLHLEQMLTAARIEHDLYATARSLPETESPLLTAMYEAWSQAIYGIAHAAIRAGRPLQPGEISRMRAIANSAAFNPSINLIDGARTSLAG